MIQHANVLSSVCVNVFLGTQIADLIYVHTMHAYVFMEYLVLLDECVRVIMQKVKQV